MRIPGWLEWAIGQGLGRKGPRVEGGVMRPAQNGYLLLEFLRGPFGALLNALSGGKPEEIVDKADGFIRDVKSKVEDAVRKL